MQMTVGYGHYKTGEYTRYKNDRRIQTLYKWREDTDTINMTGGYRQFKNDWRIQILCK